MSFVPEILDNIFSIQKTQEQYVVKILGIRIKKTIYSGIDYAICRSISSNVGEEVQWISAMRFVPEHFVMINSQNQSEYKPKKQTKLIKNGWYTHQPKNFITDKNVKPLLISVYIHRSCYKHFKSKKIRNYLIKNGPVGCRDMSTLKFLESINVPAYFSSCLSLTLIPNPDIVKKEYVLTVGLTKEQEDYIQSKTSRQVYSIERNVPLIYNTKTRFEMAKTFLALYQSAHCIILTGFMSQCLH